MSRATKMTGKEDLSKFSSQVAKLLSKNCHEILQIDMLVHQGINKPCHPFPQLAYEGQRLHQSWNLQKYL